MAEPTRLEPATSAVTGRRSNQLSYDSTVSIISQFPVICKRKSFQSVKLPSLEVLW